MYNFIHKLCLGTFLNIKNDDCVALLPEKATIGSRSGSK
jgi:hypothetical protein